MTLKFSSPEAQKRLADILAIISSTPNTTSKDVVALIGMNRSLTYAYLRRLEDDDKAYRFYVESGLQAWAPGKSGVEKKIPRPAKVGKTPEEIEAAEEKRLLPKRRYVAAKQIGMWRDSMVSALFGPAGVAA